MNFQKDFRWIILICPTEINLFNIEIKGARLFKVLLDDIN